MTLVVETAASLVCNDCQTVFRAVQHHQAREEARRAGWTLNKPPVGWVPMYDRCPDCAKKVKAKP